MKDNFIILFISLLIFITVKGDKSPNKITPILIGSTPFSTFSIIPNYENSTEVTNLPSLLVLGFKKISTEINITFNVFTRVVGREPSKLTLKAQITPARNLRFLEDINFECDPANVENNGKDNKYTFICSKPYGNAKDVIIDLDSIRIDGEKPQSSPLANYSKNLNNDVSDLFDNKELLVMKNCEFKDTENKIVIQGTIDGMDNSNNPYLLVIKDESKKNFTANYNNTGNNIYTLTLNPQTSVDANLHEQMGRINDKQSVILDFADSEGNVNYSPINVFRGKKSSSGLSTGGIIAIVIPCIAVLLAIAGLTFIMGRRSKPPMQTIEDGSNMDYNSSVGIKN